jgi:hypothetical protein
MSSSAIDSGADCADRSCVIGRDPFEKHFNHTRRNHGKNHSSIPHMLPANGRQPLTMADPMADAPSLIQELEEAIAAGSPAMRLNTLTRITDLFIAV